MNLNDMLTRHTGANHKRDDRVPRRQMAIWRMAVFMVWRNYMKRRRSESSRHAGVRLGLTE
ncbi:MAG: hypothetical protein IPJ04_04875 [Candidatus Eisenbacteria bacterium]|nr:hypothetical protein [Candidatus Eisenbacteria bacterium]